MLFLVAALKEKNKRLALSKQLASLARTSLSIQTAASRTLLVSMTPGCHGTAWRGAPPPPPISATPAAPSPLLRQPSSMHAPPTGPRAFSLDH